MYSDFIKFLHSLPEHMKDYESLLPDSLVEHIPMDSIKAMGSQLTDSMKIAGAVVTLALALLACFLGYKLARLFMTITGFLGGLAAGYVISSQVFKLSGMAVAACTLAGGILLALFAYRIYVAGIFILCFMLAFVAAAALLPFTGDMQFFLSTLIAFLVGSLSVRYIRPVIILSSAIVGGNIAAGLITTVSEFMNIYTFSKFNAGGLALIICVLGILVQFLTTSDEDEEKRKKKKLEKKAKKKEKKLERKRQKAEAAAN